jgi:hypothetical protein
MSTPNFFDFAKTELAQDAFLCWLLSWALPENRPSNQALHDTACLLIQRLFARHKIDLPEFTNLKIRPQHRTICRGNGKTSTRIDILVLVNNFTLLIEDKTTSTPHGTQLDDYLADAKRFSPKRTVVPIYLKTGTMNSDEFLTVDRAGYKVFGRRDLCDVLMEGKDRWGVKNDIFDDFLTRLYRPLKGRMWRLFLSSRR